MRQEKRSISAIAAVTVVVVSLLFAGPAPAGPKGANPLAQAQAFATCAGRMQALATRQTALHDPRSRESREIQGLFEQLLDAIIPFAHAHGADPAAARLWQASGWAEVAALLRNAQAAEDPHRAEADLSRRVATCTRMILRG
jgi:hypothetical protein